MRTGTPPLVLLAALLVAPIPAPVHGQASRTWVSGVGDDVNPCSRTAPCKTFAGAISKTAAGGEISALDSGGFGAVTITKAITLNGDGHLASALAASTNGIVVNVSGGGAVVLRNLSIHGAGTGLNGVRILAGESVTIERCSFSGLTQSGIEAAPSAGITRLMITDTSIIGGARGILLAAAPGKVRLVATRLRVTGASGNGVEVAGKESVATLVDSVIAGCGGAAVAASAAGATINVEGSVLADNRIGVDASAAGATVRVADNGIYGNATGFAVAAGAKVESDGDNRAGGNGGSDAPKGKITLE